MNKSLIALLGTSVIVSAQAEEIIQEDISSITGSEDWNTLRTVWRTLNRTVMPENQWDTSILAEKGDSISRTVNELFSAEVTVTPEVNRAVEMLKNITILRAERLSRINPALMTRMMPPWTTTVRDDLLFSFETRLHTLTELLQDREISATEFIAARDSLLDKAIVLSMLEAVDEMYEVQMYDYPFYDYLQATPDTILHRLDMSYRAALDSLNLPHVHDYADHYKAVVEQHERFMEEYADFRAALPAFRVLLENLMEVEG